jgi:TatD DNase family protein
LKLLDVHTHTGLSQKRESQIVSVDIREVIESGFEPQGPFTIGIHPWYIDELVIDDAYEFVKEYISHDQCMAIGEAGLDRSIKTSLNEQLEVFERQIQMAKDHNIHSLMIHCVRAFPDVLNLIKKKNFKGSLIFHDYNGKPEMTAQLLRYNCFFSYGEKLFNENSGGFKSFSHIPNHRILLESDDMNHKSIEDVYERAASLLKLKLESLHQTILENAESAFGKSLDLTPHSK